MNKENDFKMYDGLDNKSKIFIYEKEIRILEFELKNTERRLKYFKEKLIELVKGGQHD